jgi:histidyl-tRNA synthetase
MPAIPAPKGTNDLLPLPGKDAPWWHGASWDWLVGTHAELCRRHGYVHADTPIFEATDLFSRGIQEGTDVVDKEMFTFDDRGGRSVSLRPEGTAGMVRALLGAHLTEQRRPLRVHYAGPMFRYDRPQKGRYRQLHQVGVECLGERSPHLDAEVVALGWRFIAALGVTGVSLQINSLGGPEDRERYRNALVAYYRPHLEELCEDCRRRIDINPLRLLDCKRDGHLVESAPAITESLSDESRAFFDAVLADLDAEGIPYVLNTRLVRGLDYYADTTFEFWHTSLQGAQNALGGGGRYDGLAAVLGFTQTPGVGYAMGVERLLIIAEDLGTAPAPAAAADVALITLDEAQVAAALPLAQRLREAGLAVVVDAAARKVDRKLREADRNGARVAVIVGPDEVAAGTAVVRDLAQRNQETVPGDGLVQAVKQLLNRGM